MKSYQFNKLVRSKLPARMISEGVKINGCALSEEEYLTQLKQKLLEEAEEVSLANDRENLITELADVFEVLHAIAEANSIDLETIEQARIKKREINGHFQADHYIHYIEVEPNNHKVIEYMENKERPYKLQP